MCMCVAAQTDATREAALTSTRGASVQISLISGEQSKRGIVARTSAAATPLPFTPRRLRGAFMNRLATVSRPAGGRLAV